jgi:hypothetical protein
MVSMSSCASVLLGSRACTYIHQDGMVRSVSLACSHAMHSLYQLQGEVTPARCRLQQSKA